MSPNCARPNVDDPAHAALQSEVIEYLRYLGYLVQSVTYHEKTDAAFVSRIKSMKDVNALAMRTTADRIAVHTIEDYSFFVECKTNSGKWPNCAIEALPLALHRAKSACGTRCLYIYRDTVRPFEGCFWASDDIPVGKLFITQRFPGLRQFLTSAFPAAAPVECAGTGGSNDPYILIQRADFAFMNRNWKDVVKTPAKAVR